MSTPKPSMTAAGSSTAYTDEQRARIWSFALHLDAEFLQRGNFFLLGESMLVVAYAGILTAGPTVAPEANMPWIARIVAIFGVLLALVWMYIQVRHKGYLSYVRNHILPIFPEYAEIYSYRLRTKIPTTEVMAYVIPAFTALMWIALIAISLDLTTLFAQPEAGTLGPAVGGTR